MTDAECDDMMGLIARIPTDFGCGVLLIEHNMRVIMGVCERIHVIRERPLSRRGSTQRQFKTIPT